MPNRELLSHTYAKVSFQIVIKGVLNPKKKKKVLISNKILNQIETRLI